MKRLFRSLILCLVAAVAFGCGEEPGGDDHCSAHTDCPDDEACFDGICVEGPSKGTFVPTTSRERYSRI